ncbi:hypothetical protein [Paraburkholderia fungorum]|uniref:Uncharacterized protein n=1 Tax=Paraburkholderia fungorum TaxID=134537 RepID=A0AAW3V4B3_9BURK|nr:hypothetical protein [Paraburkholderia fungorum]MBB4517152.1 hypothetical protein [Paraburkholderia fungorum]MBB6204220.1 hypothetical protein [Paraburkholderia fungorum]
MQIDEALFTRKRVMVTARPPKFAVADPEKPWVMLEAEDGSGLTLAVMGPDSAESRADAARMMRLWNDSLDANEACLEDRQPAAEDQPDYEAAFRRVCADMGAINALLGFDDHPGIDHVLRAITELKLAGGVGAIREAGDGPRLRSETIQRVERGVRKLLVDAQHPAGVNAASAPPAGWRVYHTAPEFFSTEAEAIARVRENRRVNGLPDSYAEPADQSVARARNTIAKNVYRGIDALRWLLNITTEFDRKDVRTRQAARLLDEFFSADGITNRVELEHLWKTLYSELSLQDKLDCLREPGSRKASAEADQTLMVRAVEIADQSMVELLLAHAVRFDALTPAFGLSSENGTEVQTLEEADPAIQEAFEWLQLRDMAELLEESGGACILLKGHALEYLNLDTGQTLQ